MRSTVFEALVLAALFVAAGVSSRAAVTALHITNTGKNTEAQPTYRLDWVASSNSTYLVQSTTNPAAGASWTTLDAITPLDQSGSYPLRVVATDSTGLASAPAMFYRLILPQPQIFSVEPAIVPPGVAVDFSVFGQAFPANAVLKVNGVTQAGALVLSSSLATVPGFVPDLPGSYQVSLVISGAVVSSFTVTCADPLTNPELVLQGPPTQAPAAPIAFWLSKRGYDYYKAQSDLGYSFDIEQTLNIGSQSSGAGAGKVTFNPFSITRKIIGSQSSGAGAGKITFNPFSITRKSGGAGGGGGGMASLMKAKEKANQSKSMAGVQPFSGEVQAWDLDLAIPGRSLDFVWARTYHSRIGRTGAATNGWTFSYDVSIQPLGGDILIHNGTGRADIFKLGASGTYTCPEFFSEGTLAAGVFRLSFADTGYWEFNPLDGTATAGKLAHIVDRNGNTMSLNYDTGGRLTQVVDDLGRTNTVAYDTAGRIASVTDFSGRSVTYQYYPGAKADNGSAGDLKSVTSPPVTGTPNGNDFPSGKTTAYTYSKSFPLDRDNHLLLTVTDPKGQTAAVFTYEHTAASPNYLRCVAAQCGSNPTFTYSWSLLSRPAGSSAVVKCFVNDPVGNVTEDYFDARGRCVIERDYTGRATPGVAVTDTVNRPTGQLRSTDPAYYEARWNWNNDSLCALETTPGGQQVQCVYQSDFDPSTTARKRADCRVVRELATGAVDLNGDGVPDVTSRASYLTYDPRFGSDPTPAGDFIPFTFKLVAVKTCSWAQDPGQDAAAFTFKLVAVKTMSWSHDDESPKEMVAANNGGADAAAAAFAFKLVAVKTMSWSHDDESPKEMVASNNGGADAAAAFNFKLVAVKTMSWAHDDESPKETVTFEYGAHSSAAAFTSQLMAIKTKGTGADNNRAVTFGREKLKATTKTQGDFNLANRFSFEIDGVTSITDPRGDVTTFSYDAKGNPTTASSGGGAGKVTFNPFSITRKIDCAYDTFGQLVAITNSPDANGRRRVDTFAWSQGRVTQCVADAGAGGLAITSAFEYDARGNLTRAVDPRGNDSLFTYNALDQCVRAQSPPNITSRCTTDFSFDANDNLVQTSRDVRDAADNLVGTQVNRASYNGQDCLSEMALAMDATRAQTNRFSYDGNNQCVQVLGPDAVSGADPYQMVAYEFDERCLPFRAITAPGSSLAGTNELSYTANFNPATKKYVDAQDSLKLSVFAYDGFDRLSGVTDPMGNQAVCFFDANDNPKVVRLYGELSDVPGSAGNVRLSESSYEYDGLDRLFRTHDLSFNPATQSPIGSGDAVSTCILAPNDECVSVTDSLGRTTGFGYDLAGRPASVTDARGNISLSYRDQAGNPTAITRTELPDGGGSPQVFTATYAYDHFNRCVSSSDNVGNTSTCAYDSFGRVVRTTNPNGNDTTYAYDLLDDCLASIDYAGSSLSSGGLPPTIVRSRSAIYDTSLRCLTSTDPNGNTTSYAYDSLGNCVTTTQADGTHQQLVWSPRSNLIQATDANGTTVTNGYDLCDRIIHRDIAARGAAVASTTFETFAYDGSSRLVLANNDVSSQSFSYDSFGDCTASSQDGLAQSATYDSAGNPLSLTYPSGRVVAYAYDVLDQVTNVSTSAGGVSHPLLARFAYAGPGRLARIGRDNGLKTQIDWDGLTNPGNSAGDYGWQEVSRVRDGTVASPSLVCDVAGTYSRTQSKLTRADAGRTSLALTYDALEQLVEASDSMLPRDTLYALDAAGNRSHVITNGVLMTPDYAMSSALPPGDFFMNRYTTTPFGAQSYDANGNLIVRASAASPTFYHYDYADRLVEVDALGTLGTVGPVATFTYDALGNRISKTTYPATPPLAPVTVQYVHKGATEQCDDGNNVIEERVGTSVSRAYCDMTAFTGTGAAQYYHCDDLGNVLALTDAGGNVLERYAYDDYGNPQFLDANGSPLVGSDGQPVTASPLGNPFLFQGLEWDGETGLLGNGDGNYFDPLPASAIRGKVKTIKDMGHGRTFEGNNPWSGGGGGGGGGTEMKKGTVKFFNDAKGFGFIKVENGQEKHYLTIPHNYVPDGGDAVFQAKRACLFNLGLKG